MWTCFNVKSLLLQVPLLLQEAKPAAYKSKSFNMLYIQKQSSVQAVNSIMETDTKNLEMFLAVKQNILNKREKLSLRHANRRKQMSVFFCLCLTPEPLANCFHLSQSLPCAEEGGRPHFPVPGAPQSPQHCPGSAMPNERGRLSGTWDSLQVLAGCKRAAGLTCQECSPWQAASSWHWGRMISAVIVAIYDFSSCLYESLLRQLGYPKSLNSSYSGKPDSWWRITQIALNWISIFLSWETRAYSAWARSSQSKNCCWILGLQHWHCLAVCPGRSLFNVSVLILFYLNFLLFCVNFLFAQLLWSLCKQAGPHRNKYSSTENNSIGMRLVWLHVKPWASLCVDEIHK